MNDPQNPMSSFQVMPLRAGGTYSKPRRNKRKHGHALANNVTNARSARSNKIIHATRS